MKTKEINNLLKDAVSQSGISILLYDLKTHEVSIEVECKEHKTIVNVLQKGLFNALINANLVANDCVGSVKDFAQKIDSGVLCEQCDAFIKNEERKTFGWIHFNYDVFDDVDNNNETKAIISLKSIDDKVHTELMRSFWNRIIHTGVEKGNSYFIINVNDEFVHSSYGKLAIKTKDFKEQVNYIASMCGEASQKVHSIFSKENLLKLGEKNTACEMMDVLIQGIEGESKWYRVNSVFIKHPISGKTFVQIAFVDVDIKYREMETIKYNATHDELTDLLNKRSFMDMAIERIDKLSNNYWKALIFIDVDNFKRVNDINGHIIGDRVLRGIATGIKKSFRKTDIIGRVGGDEFMVLFAVPTLQALYSRLDLINDNIRIASQMEDLSVSFGVVVFFGKDNDFGKLYYLADKAMYAAKKQGKNRYSVIDQYSNSFLNDIVLKMDNIIIDQCMKVKTTDYIFAHYYDEKIVLDYITPSLQNSAFDGKSIVKFENLIEVLSKSDFKKVNKMVLDIVMKKEAMENMIKINGENYKVIISLVQPEIIISLQKIEV